MKYLLDTNILSEIRKSQPNRHVTTWLKSVPANQRYLSVITLGEIRRGIEKEGAQDSNYADRLEGWLNVLAKDYESRILPFDSKAADLWGRLPMNNLVHALDLQIAAIALINRCIIVTRNVRHFDGVVPDIINPFEP